MKQCLLVFCLVAAGLNAQSQKTDTLHIYNSRQSIEYMSQYITARLSQNTDVKKIAVLTGTNDVNLRPNTASISRLSLNYRFISLSASFSPKLFKGNNDNLEKGKTSGFAYAFNFTFKHWLQEVSYSKTKGYYLENTSDYRPGWKEGDPYIQFPKFVYQEIMGATGYNFNPNFSVNALTTQSERQLKSAGSFIPGAVYRYYSIADKAEIPAGGSAQKSKNYEIVAGAGYYYNFVLKQNFYICLGATPGAGFVFTKLYTMKPSETIITHQQNPIFRMDAQAGLGYNGRRFFAGLYSKLASSAYNQDKSSIVNEYARVSFSAFAGYRFNAPGWLKSDVAKASQKIGIK